MIVRGSWRLARETPARTQNELTHESAEPLPSDGIVSRDLIASDDSSDTVLLDERPPGPLLQAEQRCGEASGCRAAVAAQDA